MRDEAVASQDQDPTTEPAPAGEAGSGNGAGPSDASETIVSGSHAAPTSDGAPGAGTIPAEHDAWDAEFAGLSGSAPEQQALPERQSVTENAPVPEQQAAPEEPSVPEQQSVTENAPVPEQQAVSEEPSVPEQQAAPARAAQAQHSLAAAARDEVPGGHPSVAQRSTLPMRAASTLPNLSGYGGARSREDEPGSAAGTGPEGTEYPEAAGQDKPATGQTGTEADGGPWYGPGTGDAEPAGDAAPETEGAEISPAEARRRTAERERAAAAKPVLARVIQVAIAVFFPVMLLAAAIRAVATPLFLWVEYHRPGFPADSFGFTTEDRMTYGSYAVDYLLNFSSPRYLGDLVTSDGDPLYLASEVSHMADVKAVLTIAFLTALGMALLSLAGGIYLARRCPGGIRRALFSGAVATLALIAGLLVAAVLAWEQFFTLVHTIFFSQGNWTFRLDDTLIRLFPSQFWMDSGAVIAALVLLSCILVMIFTWPTKRRRERSRAAREESRQRYLDSLEAL